MNQLFNYIDKYGSYSFKEKEFTDVDNVILSLLSYINFSNIVSEDNNKISLKEAGEIYFSKYSKKQINSNIFSIKSAIKLFDYIKDFKRYQELELYNYKYINTDNEQFGALCIKIHESLIYISYEGTDELISGWKEDFQLSYIFPTPSQIDALKYLNASVTLKDKKVIVGGHSKGGNLALTASMYCHYWIRKKIVRIYNNDGPGLLKEQIDSHRFRMIRKKYIHIIPDQSIVGIMLENCNDYVIKSSRSGIIAHDALTWGVSDDSFLKSELKNGSKNLKNIVHKWLNEYDFEQRMICVDEIFDIFKNNNINSLLDIKDKGVLGIISILRQSKKLGPTALDMFKQLFVLIYDDYSLKIKNKIGLNRE